MTAGRRWHRCSSTASRPPRSGRRSGIPEDDGWTSVTWQQVGDRVELHRRRADLAGHRPRGSRRAGLVDALRVGARRLRDPVRRCRHHHRVSDDQRPTTSRSSSPTRAAGSSSPRTRPRSTSCVEHRAELPAVEKVVIIDGAGDGDWVITLDELEQRGKQLLADVSRRRRAIASPRSAPTSWPASSTPPAPRASRRVCGCTHGAWTYTAAAIDALGILGPDDLNFLWLPLAHAFGKVMLALPLVIGFPTAIDGRVDKIVENLAVLQPTFMGAAPRIFEKAHARIIEMIAEEGGSRSESSTGRSGWGCEVSRARQAGQQTVAAAVGPAASRRPAGVLDDPGAVRRAAAILRLRGRARWTATSRSGSTPSASSCWRATG